MGNKNSSLERYGYIIGTEIGSGTYAKVKVIICYYHFVETFLFLFYVILFLTVGLQFAATTAESIIYSLLFLRKLIYHMLWHTMVVTT